MTITFGQLHYKNYVNFYSSIARTVISFAVADPEGAQGACAPPFLFLNSLSHSYIQP